MDRIVQGVSLNETKEVGVDLTGAQLCSRVDAFELDLLDEDLQDCQVGTPEPLLLKFALVCVGDLDLLRGF